MPQRNFENQKALIDYAEQNGLVYVWEFAKRQRLRSPVPAFTKRQQLLSPDQYNIVDVRTSRGVRRAMLFPKAILQAEFAAARCSLASVSDGGRSGRRSKSDSYHKKWGDLWLGRNRPEGDDASCCEISLSRCQQRIQSGPRSATSVNPSAEAIFWTNFHVSGNGREHAHAGGTTGQACAGRGEALCRSGSVSSRNGTTTRP